jgi:hypothetical protein
MDLLPNRGILRDSASIQRAGERDQIGADRVPEHHRSEADQSFEAMAMASAACDRSVPSYHISAIIIVVIEHLLGIVEATTLGVHVDQCVAEDEVCGYGGRSHGRDDVVMDLLPSACISG